MIDKKLIQKNKKLLLEERVLLENLLSRIAKKDERGGGYHPNYPDFGNKEDENASEIATYEVNLAEEFDLQKKLRKIEAALEKIEDGTYGTCLLGGEAIPRKRLEAVPEAENCIEHAPR